MTNLHNIEASAFRKSQYIGWRASDGHLFNIARRASGWYAVRRDATGAAGDRLTATTLRGISDRLAQS